MEKKKEISKNEYIRQLNYKIEDLAAQKKYSGGIVAIAFVIGYFVCMCSIIMANRIFLT